jgi:GrpB-like predicted nucleotidyltransferase (UPF0157 family)
MTILAKHSPAWAREFERLKAIYQEALGNLMLAIEHVGSTAIPGISAKPILDIDIVIEDYDTFLVVVEGLATLGYNHRGDLGIAQREAFKRKDERVPYSDSDEKWMAHNLYVCPKSSRELRRHIAFRDALLADPSARREYERIKQDIVRRACDVRAEYVRIKEEETECRAFIESVLGDTL